MKITNFLISTFAIFGFNEASKRLKTSHKFPTVSFFSRHSYYYTYCNIYLSPQRPSTIKKVFLHPDMNKIQEESNKTKHMAPHNAPCKKRYIVIYAEK